MKKFGCQQIASGILPETFDTYKEAEEQLQDWISEDRHNWTIKKEDEGSYTYYNVYNANGDLEIPDYTATTEEEAQEWINNKEDGSEYEIVEVEED